LAHPPSEESPGHGSPERKLASLQHFNELHLRHNESSGDAQSNQSTLSIMYNVCFSEFYNRFNYFNIRIITMLENELVFTK